ncbi:vitelline envelope sperm lysin receptor-like isoform X2 [Gigantopelta aegis]|uniref:vitelline envelope sperm lysin receptor-like isoform X2 n=1 Tax=Gigantopelta aegis TaxID=1735272 RepID=UPI001B88DE32|nr:vitelline envelope sperm lysin receptor-like isoform X2 [Gigantopelta aegis]
MGVSTKCPLRPIVVRKPNSLYEVTSKCNPSPINLVPITVTADLPMTIHVHCKNNYVLQMNTSDGVHYLAHAGFTNQDGSKCLFERKSNSRMYTLILDLAWDSINQRSSILLVRDQYLVVCSYDNFGSSKTHKTSIDSSKQPPNSIYEDKGQPITSGIDLRLVDTRDNVMDSDIALGTIIRIVITITGVDFVKAQQCWATNEVRNYTILIAGCGDGVVFKKNDGFLTVNQTIYSPYFSAFRLQGCTNLTFECIVSACPVGVHCDGTSCTTENRRKRDVNARLASLQQGIGQVRKANYLGNVFKTASAVSNSAVISSPDKNGRTLRHLKNGLTVV